MSALGQERVVVIGAGSLGTVYGAGLARAGADVQLLAREAHARAIQEAGFVTIDSFGERWEVPLRARAYENGCFVIAANRVGVEGPRHHLGRSMIVDPRGTILADAGTEREGLLVAEIDLDEVRKARKDFPWWRDRRPELYGALV